MIEPRGILRKDSRDRKKVKNVAEAINKERQNKSKILKRNYLLSESFF